MVTVDMKWLSHLLILSAFCAPVIAHDQNNFYVYDSEIDARAIVLNLEKLTFSFQDKNSIQLENVTEFSGDLENCDNGQYYCLSGPISIVIPKHSKFGQANWFYHDVRCVVESETSREERKIICLRTGDANGTEVNYSINRGVLSIRKKSSKDDQSVFQLRGYCGLFAKLSYSECTTDRRRDVERRKLNTAPERAGTGTENSSRK